MTSLARVFGFPGVAEAYRHRPPYPPETFDILDALMVDTPRTVLDLGAGEGALARPLAERADRVDAVEISAAMADAGRRRPGGDRANLRWIVSAAETCELSIPYALSTAPVPFRQPLDDYLEHLHSTASLARELMTEAEAAEFREAARRAVAPWARDGVLEMAVIASVHWGRPR